MPYNRIIINFINNNGEDVNFVLIDADHEYEGVYNDIKNILMYKPKNDMVVIIHDSWYPPSRSAICDVDWNSNPYVQFIDTDYCSYHLK